MNKKQKKQYLIEIMGYFFAWMLLLFVGSLTLMSNSNNTSIGYGTITLIGGLVGLIIMSILQKIGHAKKINKKILRGTVCYGSIFSLSCAVLGLAIFLPPVGFSMIGGIIAAVMIVMSHIGSLLTNKKEYFKMYRFK